MSLATILHISKCDFVHCQARIAGAVQAIARSVSLFAFRGFECTAEEIAFCNLAASDTVDGPMAINSSTAFRGSAEWGSFYMLTNRYYYGGRYNPTVEQFNCTFNAPPVYDYSAGLGIAVLTHYSLALRLSRFHSNGPGNTLCFDVPNRLGGYSCLDFFNNTDAATPSVVYGLILVTSSSTFEDCCFRANKCQYIFVSPVEELVETNWEVTDPALVTLTRCIFDALPAATANEALGIELTTISCIYHRLYRWDEHFILDIPMLFDKDHKSRKYYAGNRE
jgi:hypothetical protein